MPETAWPEGVIARYLTVGGATVDLTHVTYRSDEGTHKTDGVCSACHVTKEFCHWIGSGAHFDGTFEEVRAPELADEQARAWAQSHAEKCRAMPRPTA